MLSDHTAPLKLNDMLRLRDEYVHIDIPDATVYFPASGGCEVVIPSSRMEGAIGALYKKYGEIKTQAIATQRETLHTLVITRDLAGLSKMQNAGVVYPENEDIFLRFVEKAMEAGPR